MTHVLAQRDLRNHNADVITRVVAGETFVITRNGTPVAELRPIEPPRRTLVSKAEVLRVARSSVRLDSAAFRRDLDEHVDQSLGE